MDIFRTTTSRTLRSRSSVVPAVALTLALLAAACGGEDDASSDEFSSMPAPAATPGMLDIMSDGDAGTKVSGEIMPGTGSGVEGRTEDGRAIVRNASIELVVDDGADAVDAVAEQVLVFGGHVTTTALSRDEDGTVSGTLVLRVPADRLDELVDALDGLARSVPFRTIDEMDVTLELSDLDARLENLRAFEDELRTLLTEVRERDGTVEGLVAVAAQLNAVRTEIDMFEGRRIQLADLVAMSTVFVSISQARSTTPVVGTWDLPTVVRDALAATVRLGQLVVEGVVWLLLTVAPALVALVVVIGIVRAVRRRRAPAPADVDLPS